MRNKKVYIYCNIQIHEAMSFEKQKYHQIATSGMLVAVSRRFDGFIKVYTIK